MKLLEPKSGSLAMGQKVRSLITVDVDPDPIYKMNSIDTGDIGTVVEIGAYGVRVKFHDVKYQPTCLFNYNEIK